MKSLLIVSDFPPMVGGIATFLGNVWSNLPKKGLYVLAPKVGGSDEFDKKQNYKIFRYRTTLNMTYIARFYNFLLLLWHVFWLTIRYRIEQFHCGQPVSAGIIGLIFKKLFKIKYYIYVYGGELMKFGKNKFILLLLRIILRNADKVITNSTFTTRVYLNFGVEKKKLIKICPGVDTERFKPGIDFSDLEKRYGLKDRKVILTVSRLTQRKGQDTVIKALNSIIEKIPTIVYLIVGKGPDEERLKKLVKEFNLGEHVIFTGFVPDEELPKCYNACDIYVMPNRFVDNADNLEGFGISFIEASACGKPVIGGGSGGSGDAIVNRATGILVTDPSSHKEVANAVIKILKDESYAKELGENGRLEVERNFQWKYVAEKVRALL